jgi:hypothetical protein
MLRKTFRPSLFALLFTLLVGHNASFAYQKDAATHTLTVSPSTNAAQNTNELRGALSFLVSRPDKTTPWRLLLNPGKYVMSAQVIAQGLQNTTIASANPASPAKLVKMPGWNSATSAEYLLNFRMGKNINLSGIEFYGQTSFATNVNPYWPDQGVYFGSCDTVKIDKNKFYNFGNSALRVATWERDPVVGVHSFNTTVTNNLFNNIYQTSTTVQDNIHGASAHYTMANNNFVNVRGSIKFASRTPGATDVHFINNVINGGDHFGLEINNYQNFEIRGNTIANIKGVAMDIYTAAGIPGFKWGDNFTIADNTIKTSRRAIRFSHEAAIDGFQNIPTNMVISNNTMSGITEPNTGVPALMEERGKVSGLQVTGNKFYSVASKKYISVTQGSTGVSILNNAVDGVAYGPQSTTASR